MSEPFINCILTQKERLAASEQEIERLRAELRTETDKRDTEIARLRADRRERIATACLAGLIACPKVEGNSPELSEAALSFADALIARLDREA
jgi:hypothetical protein